MLYAKQIFLSSLESKEKFFDLFEQIWPFDCYWLLTATVPLNNIYKFILPTMSAWRMQAM